MPYDQTPGMDPVEVWAVRTRRRFLVIALLPSVVVTVTIVVRLHAAVLLPFLRIRTLEERYRKVERGDTLDRVRLIMREPGELTPLGPSPQAWWDDERLDDSESARIRSRLQYPTETFYLPVTFEFSFDEHGVVVGRHRID
jgi:hypothetical protein